MSRFTSPQPIHHSAVVRVMVPTPLASAVKLPMSPLWCSGSVHLPCFLKVGFQWPLAELASAAEQSAFSWMWMAWTPGVNPTIRALNVTSPLVSIKVATPVTLLLLLGCNTNDTRSGLELEVLDLHPNNIPIATVLYKIIFFIIFYFYQS